MLFWSDCFSRGLPSAVPPTSIPLRYIDSVAVIPVLLVHLVGLLCVAPVDPTTCCMSILMQLGRADGR